MLHIQSPIAVYHDGTRLLRWRGAGLPGSPLVLLHGLGDGADIWNPVLAQLPSGPLAAIGLDLPGHGGSDWLDDPSQYRVDHFADRVAQALQREGVRKPVIIGHSLGGRVALELVSSGRLAAERVVLVDVNPEPQVKVGDAVSDHLDALIAGAPSLDLFSKQIIARLPLSDPNVVSEAMTALVAAKATPSGQPGVSLPLDPEIKRFLKASNRGGTGWASLSALTCPVAIIRGEYSSALDVKTALKMANSTRRPAQAFTVPKAGHAIALEQPKLLAAALTKAINGQSGRI